MIVDENGTCRICGWEHGEDEDHHAYAPGETDVFVVLCPDGKRRHLTRATAFAAWMCADRAAMLCRALPPREENRADVCAGGVHTFERISKDDPRGLVLLSEDNVEEDPYNRYRAAIEHPMILPGMPINLVGGG